MKLIVRALPSLQKVFPDEAPAVIPFRVRGLQNEELSWQLAYTLEEENAPRYLTASIDSPIASQVHIRQVRAVPVGFPTYTDADDHYLRKVPGLFPDLLREIAPHNLRAYPGRWDALWISLAPQDLAAGSYPVTIRLSDEAGSVLAEHTQQVELLPAQLPPQSIIHTKWFHCDCLAEYYHVPVFSEAHWQIIENFVKEAVHEGINMLLTPIHTPPLDTRVGSQRLTTQLVDITVKDGQYFFVLDKVRRWIHMAKRCGIQYFEMAHLFTQWGAQHAPKIVATVDGTEQRIFGWESDATDAAYGAFLRAYIPALRKVFQEEGIEDQVWWHISDEPSEQHLSSYLAARRQVSPVLEGAHMMDALSNYAFYREGLVTTPVVALNHLDDFLNHNVPGLWTYYCCGQYKDVTNMFIAMPGARTRVLGMQLYKYHMAGFLQWGFNFYKSQYSDYPIDPYATTDGDGFSPAGDPFLVYPGPDGKPESSIRHELSREAFQDLRALQLLDSLVGEEKVQEILKDLTLTSYPTTDQGFLALREQINDSILAALPTP